MYIALSLAQEFDEPFALLQNKNSALYELVQQTGKSMATSLLGIATNVSF